MSAARSTHLDPRAPFVLDTRELGRRPGSMRAAHWTAEAPEGWGLELVRVPAGTPVELDLRMESVMDGVLVTGALTAEVDAECGRCLEPLRTELDADVQELFAYAPDPGEDLPTLDGDFIDLEPLVRDAIVLALPLNPVCGDDCTGLCTGCGEPLRTLDPEHTHDAPDPRWAALTALAAPMPDTAPEPTASNAPSEIRS
jgi:uncharacterized protein